MSGGRTSASLGARALRPLILGLRRLGHDPAPLLREAGLDAVALQDLDRRIPSTAVAALWRGALEATRDPNLGLHLAVAADPGAFDLHAYALFSSPTLGAGLARMAAYQRLINDANRLVVDRGRGRCVVRHLRPGGLAVSRQPAEFLVAVWLRLARLATGADIVPLEVRFAHPAPADVSEHARLFKGPLRFGVGENALVLAEPDVQRECLGRDPWLAAVLERHATDRLARVPSRGARLSDRVRQALEEGLAAGPPRSRALAARFHMSARTLQRALAEEGTSVSALLDGARRVEAMRLLEDSRCPMGEVAFRLGFGGLSPFYRAFRRWTGQAPGAFRRAPPPR